MLVFWFVQIHCPFFKHVTSVPFLVVMGQFRTISALLHYWYEIWQRQNCSELCISALLILVPQNCYLTCQFGSCRLECLEIASCYLCGLRWIPSRFLLVQRPCIRHQVRSLTCCYHFTGLIYMHVVLPAYPASFTNVSFYWFFAVTCCYHFIAHQYNKIFYCF